MLTKVRYFNDSQYDASYTYVKPNVGSKNGFPLLKSCQDTMYAGPMKNITYFYASGTPPAVVAYGQISSEKSRATGNAVVSTLITSGAPGTRTEMRGDGATRSFTYANGMLQSWTDFNGVPSSQLYDSNGFLKSVTDRRGTTTDFVSDPITGNVALITLPLTNSDSARPTIKTVYGYPGCPDPNNQDGDNPFYVYSVTNERGLTTTYLRDANKRVIRINYSDGSYETFSYDDAHFGQVSTHRMTSGATMTYVYGSTGLLANSYPSETPSDPNPSSHPTYFTYDANDQLSTIQDPRGKTATLHHNLRGQLTIVQHPRC